MYVQVGIDQTCVFMEEGIIQTRHCFVLRMMKITIITIIGTLKTYLAD